MQWLGNCDKFYFTFEFELPNVSLNLPKIQERPNTYLPFIKLVKSEYQSTNRYSNKRKYKLILAYQWKTEIKLFVNSHKYLKFLGQHHILPHLFANIVFKCHSTGSGFTKIGYVKAKLFI